MIVVVLGSCGSSSSSESGLRWLVRSFWWYWVQLPPTHPDSMIFSRHGDASHRVARQWRKKQWAGSGEPGRKELAIVVGLPVP